MKDEFSGHNQLRNKLKLLTYYSENNAKLTLL